MGITDLFKRKSKAERMLEKNQKETEMIRERNAKMKREQAFNEAFRKEKMKQGLETAKFKARVEAKRERKRIESGGGSGFAAFIERGRKAARQADGLVDFSFNPATTGYDPITGTYIGGSRRRSKPKKKGRKKGKRSKGKTITLKLE